MIKALVIDDEQMARDTIELFIKKYTPDIQLIGKAGSVTEGVRLIQQTPPDILFLDINMPEKKGFAIFDEIELSHIKVIFTTAYSEYAIKAINLSASYYLLKPISPVEFKKAVEKTLEKINQQVSYVNTIAFLKNLIGQNHPHPKQLLINNRQGYELIKTEDIMFLEGEKNYTWIHHSDKKHLVAKPLKDYEEFLDPGQFFRIHQSFLINRHFIKKIYNTKPDQVELHNNTRINISRDKKRKFIEWLER